MFICIVVKRAKKCAWFWGEGGGGGGAGGTARDAGMETFKAEKKRQELRHYVHLHGCCLKAQPQTSRKKICVCGFFFFFWGGGGGRRGTAVAGGVKE